MKTMIILLAFPAAAPAGQGAKRVAYAFTGQWSKCIVISKPWPRLASAVARSRQWRRLASAVESLASLVVMELHGLGADVRFQGAVVVRQRRHGVFGHGVAPRLVRSHRRPGPTTAEDSQAPAREEFRCAQAATVSHGVQGTRRSRVMNPWRGQPVRCGPTSVGAQTGRHRDDRKRIGGNRPATPLTNLNQERGPRPP